MLLLINLLGGVALLIWGLRMVRTGVFRAFGANLRSAIAMATGNRWTAFASGLGVTMVLQSATATCLIASSFAARGLMNTATSLAVMLGADVGTAVTAKLLSFAASWLPPALMFIGVVVFLTDTASRRRDVGRLVIGLGLMLFALKSIVAASAPLRELPILADLFHVLAGQPVLAVLLAALLTWLAHSSLAIVLLTLSLATHGVLEPEVAVALVLGANLGGALPAILASMSESAEGRRVAFGNGAVKTLGVLGFLLVGPHAEVALASLWSTDMANQVVDFHIAFNLGLAIIFLPLIEVTAAAMVRFFPTQPAASGTVQPRYLDRSAVETPSLALSLAARETLHMGDLIEQMLKRTIVALTQDDRRLVGEIENMDDGVDRLHEAIKLYVTEIARENLDDAEAKRAMDIILFTTNLEHIGDIIDKNLMELAAKKIKGGLSFSKEGFEELSALHELVTDNLRLALGVFISGDVKIARQLLEEKVRIRDVERSAAENHVNRLWERRSESMATSSLHLDILRDLKRIHSHICSVAYPILEASGELSQNRLRPADAAPVPEVAPETAR